MTTIFPSAVIPVITMMVVLELGKLSSVSFLHRHWKTSPALIKSYLIIAVFILMLINSMGIFGFLSKAHIDQEVINTNQASQTELVLSKIENEKYTINDFEKQINQIDANIDKLTSTGKAQTSITQATAQRKSRDLLMQQKQSHVAVLEDLNKQRLTEEAANKKLQADFGPLTYIADIFYGNPSPEQLENIVRWIITILVTVFDPLALVLLVSAQFMFKNREKKLTDIQRYDILEIKENITKGK